MPVSAGSSPAVGTSFTAWNQALWNCSPIREGERPATFNDTLDITMDPPNGPVRLLGVHPPTPIFRFDGWVNDLGTFGEVGGAAHPPTLVIGDFNASYWHPAFRDIRARASPTPTRPTAAGSRRRG